jgi:hypothetical protein
MTKSFAMLSLNGIIDRRINRSNNISVLLPLVKKKILENLAGLFKSYTGTPV